MERVQFQQEQMLAELKDLVEKGLFTKVEIKQIMKKRTEFETALIRRIPKKSDYLRYAAYEMDLESLRKKRAARILDKHSPPSVSDYALVQRQFHIFERACKKFKSDVGMWIQYIQLADKMGARALVGKITAKALQMHPNVSSLYILAASHELHSLSTSAARTLLQRGIRLNAEDIQLWTEYVKMELGFIEGLRRRWNVLGLDLDADPGSEEEMEPLDGVDEEKATETGRRQIMQGAIVKSVMTNAVEALPRYELLRALKELICGYPLPETLRDGLLKHLYALLKKHVGEDGDAMSMLVAQYVESQAQGTELVDGVKRANEEFMEGVRRSQGQDGMCCAYVRFVEEWCKKEIDANIKQYLLSSIGSLEDEFEKETELVAGRLRIVACPEVGLFSPEKILKMVRKVACKGKTTRGDVWLARLEAEMRYGTKEEVEEAWKEARRYVSGDLLGGVPRGSRGIAGGGIVPPPPPPLT